MGQDAVQTGTFWSLLNVSFHAGAQLGLAIVVENVLSILKVTFFGLLKNRGFKIFN